MTTGLDNPAPNPQDPDSPLYQFISTQPLSPSPNNPDSSPSHFTNRQIIPTGITTTKPITVTSPNHNLLPNQTVRATKFYRLPYASATGMEQLNNNLYYVQNITTDTFQLYDRNALPIDGRGYTTYVQGGLFTQTGQDLTLVNPSNFPPQT